MQTRLYKVVKRFHGFRKGDKIKFSGPQFEEFYVQRGFVEVANKPRHSGPKTQTKEDQKKK